MRTQILRTAGRAVTAALPLILLLPLALAAGTAAAEEGAGEKKPDATVVVAGKLEVEKSDAGEKSYSIEVGERTWRLSGEPGVVEKLDKLKHKYVRVRGIPSPTDDKSVVALTIGKADAVEAQERGPVEGTVRCRTAGESRHPEYFLEVKDGEIALERSDTRRFEEFLDRHVEAVGYLVSDGRSCRLTGVRSVERKLRPGERDPKRGEDALAGRWDGTFTATEVPKGIPAAKKGDYPASISVPEALEKSHGKFMGYDVVGLRLRKSDLRRRTVEFDLSYTFGSGSWPVRCEGTFSADWKTLSGTWKSSFLGSGTFELSFGAGKDN